MIIYRGFREDNEPVVIRTENEIYPDEFEPDESLKVRNHSPTGFNWGYSGSGPAQLALALLLDALGNRTLAENHYQDFKSAVVARWDDCWQISDADILKWVSENIRRRYPHWFTKI